MLQNTFLCIQTVFLKALHTSPLCVMLIPIGILLAVRLLTIAHFRNAASIRCGTWLHGQDTASAQLFKKLQGQCLRAGRGTGNSCYVRDLTKAGVWQASRCLSLESKLGAVGLNAAQLSPVKTQILAFPPPGGKWPVHGSEEAKKTQGWLSHVSAQLGREGKSWGGYRPCFNIQPL